MRRAALFRNNQSQAVRIPRDMEFTDVKEVEIVKVGQNILLRPFGKKTREDLIAEFDAVEPWPEDFDFKRPDRDLPGRIPDFASGFDGGEESDE